MALVVRYFAPTAQGAGDGTSVANAAALFPSGAWSSVITEFDFSINAMEARLLPGLYTYTSASSLSIATAPTVVNPIAFHGADASGSRLVPPDPDWTSDQPSWDDSVLPTITWGNNITISAVSASLWNCVRFVPTGVTNRAAVSAAQFSWCSFGFSSDNSAAYLTSPLFNCVVRVEADNFAAAWSSGSSALVAAENTRFECVGGTSGDRHAIVSAGTSNFVYQAFRCCTVIGFPGCGFADLSTTTASRTIALIDCNFVNNGVGIRFSPTASSVLKIVQSCCITGSSGPGVDGQSGAVAQVANCRLRDNAGGDLVGLGNYPGLYDNYLTDATDADDYQDAANGDYRIRATAGFANRGIGVSQMASSGGTGSGRRRAMWNGNFGE